MLAAVVIARSYRDAINDIKKTQDADLIELRLDYIKKLDDKKLRNIIRSCKKSVIVTIRKKDEGGFFIGNEKGRIQILENAIKYNADYIDTEYSSNKKSIKELIRNKENSKIIISYHNSKETPANLMNIYNNIKKLEPDLIKIVTYANSVSDNFKIFNLIKTAKKEERKVIAFCMGPYGEFSRILSIIFGSQITYASIDKGKESVASQLTLDEMNNIYRIKKLNKNTKIYGLIGNPVEHSWSHIIHNAGFDKFGINSIYLKFKVNKLKEFIACFKKLNIGGFSVTIPHKIDTINFLDKKAEKIGAVNTIVVRNKKLIGYNTDCDGAIQALKKKTKLKGKNIAVIGAGGASRAIVYGLKEENANITILNRTLEKAKWIAKDFGCNYGQLNKLKDIEYDILINTTPIGMHPNFNALPIPSKLIKKNKVVFDIVFNPYKTKLLKEAEKKDCVIISGIEMLIYGALFQFKLWTGRNVPKQLIRKKILGYLKNASN